MLVLCRVDQPQNNNNNNKNPSTRAVAASTSEVCEPAKFSSSRRQKERGRQKNKKKSPTPGTRSQKEVNDSHMPKRKPFKRCQFKSYRMPRFFLPHSSHIHIALLLLLFFLVVGSFAESLARLHGSGNHFNHRLSFGFCLCYLDLFDLFLSRPVSISL